MIEVAFTESAGGGLKLAQNCGRGVIGEAVDVIVINDDGSPASEAQIQQARNQALEHLRKRREQAVPLGGSSRDVFCLPLGLSVGDIHRDVLGEERLAFLREFYVLPGDEFRDVAEEMMNTARESLDAVLTRAKLGEPVRVWYSDNPDELCGFCHLMSCLSDEMDIRAVKLPECAENENGYIIHSGWGEVLPEHFHRFLPLEVKITPVLRRMYATRWRDLCEENAPLRACINGRAASAREDLYDFYILREINRAGEEFHEARVIGNILGRYQLKISDMLIARRIEKLVRDRKLIPLTEAGEDEPGYRRMLRKASAEEITVI